MPLRNVRIAPGFNKADTPSGAEGQWIDGDFVRFRYGQPEKIGGYTAIGQQTISGPTEKLNDCNSLAIPSVTTSFELGLITSICGFSIVMVQAL